MPWQNLATKDDLRRLEVKMTIKDDLKKNHGSGHTTVMPMELATAATASGFLSWINGVITYTASTLLPV
jgi:hypothetical protein